jgi:TctA family transporter
MEGAGSLLAASYMFNKAEADGLVVGNFNSGMVTKGFPGRVAAKRFWACVKNILCNFTTFLTGTVLGFWIGVMPGTGVTPASFFELRAGKEVFQASRTLCWGE